MSHPLKPLLRAALLAACAASLSGCISLLPKTKPAQLYRFEGARGAAAAAPADARPPFGVLKLRADFDRAASGDRILTVSDNRVAYIAEARWVSPAIVLFDEALSRAFDDNAGPARLVSRGEAGRAAYILRLDVRDFEAVYESGPEAAPTIVVGVRASLTRSSDRVLVGEQLLESRVKASDNRVSAITAGFGQAVSEVLAKLVDWTNQAGASA